VPRPSATVDYSSFFSNFFFRRGKARTKIRISSSAAEEKLLKKRRIIYRGGRPRHPPAILGHTPYRITITPKPSPEHAASVVKHRGSDDQLTDTAHDFSVCAPIIKRWVFDDGKQARSTQIERNTFCTRIPVKRAALNTPFCSRHFGSSLLVIVD
jgi:hypothetical protein